MRRRIRVLIIMTAAFFMLGGCKGNVQEAKVERQKISGLKVLKAGLQKTPEYIHSSGTIEPERTAIISAKIMGVIESVKVKEGGRAAKGSLLLTISSREADEKIRAAEANFRAAQKALELAKENESLATMTEGRYKKLLDEKAISAQEYDTIRNRSRQALLGAQAAEEALKAAEAALDEARVYGGYAKITAPFSGIVSEKKADEGSMALPGNPLLVLQDTSALKIDIRADERYLGNVKEGMEAFVEIPSTGEKIQSRITEISRSIDPLTRTFGFKATLENNNIGPGMYARIKVPVSEKEALLIPEKAIVRKGQLTGVYAVDEANVITFRLIRLAEASDGLVEIISGLEPGERFVAEGIEKATDGGLFIEQG